jgi:hypothetical protein
MPVSLTFTEPSTFSVEASERVTCDEALAAIDELAAHPRLDQCASIIVDARTVSGVPSTPELRAIAWSLRRVHATGASALAIVTDTTFVYGVARMFSVLAEPSGIDVSVFRCMEDARRSLGCSPV